MPYIEQNSPPSAALFDLVKSLNGSEKRYFKLMASLQKGEKNYLRLFDAVDAQTEYDEEEIRRQFQEEGFSRQLHVAKHYLYNLILKSLRSYHARLSVEMELREILADARILYERGLAELCRQTLERAQRLAEQHERHLEMLEILRLRDRWFPTPIDSDREIERLYEQRWEILRRLENLYEYDRLGNRVGRIVMGSGKARTQNVRDDFAEILAHPLMQNEEQALSGEALRDYYFIHSTIHYATGEHEEALRWTELRMEAMEKEEGRIRSSPYGYVGILINLLTLYRGNDQKKFYDSLEKLRSLPRRLAQEGFRSPLFSYWVFANVSGIELSNLLALGEFGRVLSSLPEVEEGLRKAGRFVRQVDRMRFHFIASYAFFGTGDYRNALCHIGKVLQSPRNTPRQEVLYTARMMELLVYFEMGEVILFDYKLQALQRLLARRGRLLTFETILLKSLRRLPNCTHREITVDLLRDLYERLAPLRSDPLEQHAFEYFDYLAWLRSKIEGTSFADGIKREQSDGRHEPSAAEHLP